MNKPFITKYKTKFKLNKIIFILLDLMGSSAINVFAIICFSLRLSLKYSQKVLSSFANQIFESYGHLSGDDLEKLNHQETPWKNARQGLKPWQSSNNIISENDMKDYYRSLML